MGVIYIPEKRVLNELGLSRQTLYRWRLQGLPYYKVSKIIMYNPDDINRFIGAQQNLSYFTKKRDNQTEDVIT